jgi:tetratricopeptide (TPR) repeat protein
MPIRTIPMLSLVGLLVLQGCAYSSAMSKGARMEGSGDYLAAYTAYQQAVSKKPEEPEAKDALARAATALADQAISKARDALAIGDHEVMMEQLTTAAKYESDRPEVFQIAQEGREDMRVRYERHWTQGEVDEAYDMAVRTRALYDDSEHLEQAFSDLRGHFRDNATALLRRKQHEEALATLRTITKYEPDRTGDIAALEQTILTAWGEDLAKRASSNARSRRYGAAAVLYARAYEVAGDRGHLEQSRKIAANLEADGKLTVDLRVAGQRGRTETLKEGIVTGFTGISDTELVTGRADLTVRVDVGTQTCTEEDEVTPTEKDYISGQVEEPNPEFHQLQDALAAERETEADAKAKSEALFPDVARAEETLNAIDTELEGVNRELATAEASLTEAQTQLERSKTRRDELAARLQELQATGATATANSVQDELSNIGGIINEWSGEVLKRADAASALKRKKQGLEVDRKPAAEALQRLKSGYDALVQTKNDAARKASDLSLKLSSTPKTVWKDVHETLKYDIHDWTRSCIAPVTVTLSPRWETTQSTREVYAPAHETKDRSHIGHVKAEVLEDVKEYPDTDEALVAKGDAATVTEIVSWLETVAADHFKHRRTDTAVALVEKPVDATTALVELYVGAQGRLDEAAVKMFETHVESHFGLEDIALLRPQ